MQQTSLDFVQQDSHQSMILRLDGFWEADLWELNQAPLGKVWRSQSAMTLSFQMKNRFLKQELKWVFQQQFLQQKWSPGNTSILRDLNQIVAWLNERDYPFASFLDSTLEQWISDLQHYVEQRGIQQTYRRKRTNIHQEIVSRKAVDTRISMMKVIYRALLEGMDRRSPWEKDRWYLDQLLPKEDISDRIRQLNFSEIELPWLKDLAKQYLRARSSRFGRSQLKVDLASIRYLSKSLIKHSPQRKPEDFCRQDIIQFCDFLVQQGLGRESRIMYTSGIKNFLERSIIEGWGKIPYKNYVTSTDFPRKNKTLPRAIPEGVLDQLERRKNEMPLMLARQYTILAGTGIRIIELMILPFDCLIQDHVSDYFLRYRQPKMKEEHSVPVTPDVVTVIKAQQEEVILNFKKAGILTESSYLFPSLKVFNRPGHPANFRNAINKFAVEACIVDENDKIWRFEPHQFRHTFGTRLINNGVPQHIVQKLYNHKSPEMTSRYAHLSDQTLKTEFFKGHGRIINIYGKVIDEVPENQTDLQ